MSEHNYYWRVVESHHGPIDALCTIRKPSLIPEICKHEQNMATMLTQVRAVVLLDQNDTMLECHVFRPDPNAPDILVAMR